MDKTQRRTIIYGDSLILEGVQAELSGNPDLEVLTLDQSLGLPLEALRRLNPAVIIFDLGSVQPDFPLAMLQQPDLLLIGIDLVSHQARVWSGRQAAAVVAADLVEIIRNERRGSNDTEKGRRGDTESPRVSPSPCLPFPVSPCQNKKRRLP